MAVAADNALLTSLCWLLDRAAHGVLSELAVALEGVGISPRAHEVLTVAMAGERTQIELARMIGLDKTTMVTTVDELERAGWAERRPSPTDRRARVIAVTRAGAAKVREGDEVIHAVHEELLSSLPAEEREPLMAALRHLVTGRLAVPVETSSPAARRRRAA